MFSSTFPMAMAAWPVALPMGMGAPSQRMVTSAGNMPTLSVVGHIDAKPLAHRNAHAPIRELEEALGRRTKQHDASTPTAARSRHSSELGWNRALRNLIWFLLIFSGFH